MFKLITSFLGFLCITQSYANDFVSASKQSSFPIAQLSTAGFSAEGLARIDTFFASEISKKRVPGSVVGILRDGKLVYFKAHGLQDPQTKTTMPVDAIFALASMTKPMVSVGVLTLTQQGKLPLYGKAIDYYPELSKMKVTVPKGDGTMDVANPRRPITIQDLLRHTSGLTYGGRSDTGGGAAALYPSGGDLLNMRDTQEFISKVEQLPLVYQPGTVFEYGISFEMLGAIIEKVANMTLDQYLRESVWAPLGMQDTGFHVPESKKFRQARAFLLNPLDGKPQRIPPVEKDLTFECGGGCALGTVLDYLKFGQMLVNGGTFNGKRILSPQMVQLLISNQLGKDIVNRVANVEPHRDGYGFGLGMSVRLEPGLAAVPGNVGEFSWNGSYGTAFFADPKEKLVVVFGTAAPGELRKYYREQVQDLVYGAMTR